MSTHRVKKIDVASTYHKPCLTVENVNNEARLTEPIGERHEKQHGQNGRTDEFEEVDVRPQVLVFVVHFFVPAGVGHVEDEWSEVKIDRNKESTDVAYIYIEEKWRHVEKLGPIC